MEITAEIKKIQDKDILPIPIEKIAVKDTMYSFHHDNPSHLSLLQKELQMLGQLFPVTVEETKRGRYRLLDGFRRVEIAKKLKSKEPQWEIVTALILNSDEATDLNRFHLLCAKNMQGSDGYRLFEKSKFFKFFFDRGFSIRTLSRISDVEPRDIEDLIDISELDPQLGFALDDSKLTPALAGILVRAHKGWRLSTNPDWADHIFNKLVSLSLNEDLTMKTWRFYIQFYWNDKPRPLR